MKSAVLISSYNSVNIAKKITGIKYKQSISYVYTLDVSFDSYNMFTHFKHTSATRRVGLREEIGYFTLS